MYGNVMKTWKIQKVSKRLVKEINIKKHLSILNTKDYEVNAYPFLSVATQVWASAHCVFRVFMPFYFVVIK